MKTINNCNHKNQNLAEVFLNNVNHEIRTPVNAILGFSKLLKDDSGIEKKDEYVDIIIESSKKLIDNIDNLIMLSNLQSGNIKVENKPVNIRTLLNGLFNEYLAISKKVREGKINLLKKELDIYDYEELVLDTDETLVTIIFKQLLDNAIKFTDKGNIEFGYQTNSVEAITFFVKDQGIGISKEKKDQIFEQFVQDDISYTRNYEGCGIGLAICKGITQLMKGEIWYESNNNKGTTFYFNLPYHIIENKQIRQSKEKTKPTILVVEDDEPSSLYIKEILEDQGMFVYNVYLGYDATQFVLRHKEIDLVVMDVKLPDINGLKCSKIIKSIRQDIPIIVQTAYQIEEIEWDNNDIYWEEVIHKPINRTLLLDAISKYIKINAEDAVKVR
jgi:CheY-like chemotaxis protein